MSFRRLLAIGTIFIASSFGWMLLGISVASRADSATESTRRSVVSVWGKGHEQKPPRVWRDEAVEVVRHVSEQGSNAVEREERHVEVKQVPVPLQASRIRADVSVDHRRKGLMWHPTYRIEFDGKYRVRNPLDRADTLHVHFPYPATDSVYDDVRMVVGGEPADISSPTDGGIGALVELAPREAVEIEVSYGSRGVDKWSYALGEHVSHARDFQLDVFIDQSGYDFPEGTIAPSSTTHQDGEHHLQWSFDSLVSGKGIAVAMPTKLNPGPVVSRIAFFAPISLLFFITVLVILGAVRGPALHPMHYFFLSGAFFSFHLLLAYLVDHLDIHLSFAIAAGVSVGLVVSYLRIVAGTGFALLRAGLSQLVFLVLFSYAFFYEGKSGLTITLGAVATLFVLMQVTGRVDWDVVFGRHERRGGPALGPYRTALQTPNHHPPDDSSERP